jgi:small subunit ribosomal protein S16
LGETTPVAVKIKLKRLGKIRAPYYRIVVADARTKRDGRAIEEIGKYHPKADPSFIEVDSERAQHWLAVGAQPTDPVRKILEITGDWQKFKGLPGSEGTLKVAAPREDHKEIFAAAVKETLGDEVAPPKGRGSSARSASRKDKEQVSEQPAAAKAETDVKDTAAGKAEKPARGRSGGARGSRGSGSGGAAKETAKAHAEDASGDAKVADAATSASSADAEPAGGE